MKRRGGKKQRQAVESELAACRRERQKLLTQQARLLDDELAERYAAEVIATKVAEGSRQLTRLDDRIAALEATLAALNRQQEGAE